MNYRISMSVAEPGTDLFDVVDRLLGPDPLPADQMLQIATRHIFEHEIVKNGPDQVAGRAMANAANDIRVANPIESDGLVLKVLNQRSLEIRVQIVLQKDIEGFNDDVAVRRLRRCQDVAGKKNLRVAAPAEQLTDVIPFIKAAVI